MNGRNRRNLPFAHPILRVTAIHPERHSGSTSEVKRVAVKGEQLRGCGYRIMLGSGCNEGR